MNGGICFVKSDIQPSTATVAASISTLALPGSCASRVNDGTTPCPLFSVDEGAETWHSARGSCLLQRLITSTLGRWSSFAFPRLSDSSPLLDHHRHGHPLSDGVCAYLLESLFPFLLEPYPRRLFLDWCTASHLPAYASWLLLLPYGPRRRNLARLAKPCNAEKSQAGLRSSKQDKSRLSKHCPFVGHPNQCKTDGASSDVNRT